MKYWFITFRLPQVHLGEKETNDKEFSRFTTFVLKSESQKFPLKDAYKRLSELTSNEHQSGSIEDHDEISQSDYDFYATRNDGIVSSFTRGE